MTVFSFQPATREQARARIGLQGPAGSGKTKTALRLAEGLAKGGTIGVVDTERKSALKYATVPGLRDLGGHDFGHMPMDNHDPRNLIEAVKVAEAAGIAVLIVDSWSHFWNGRGGLLSIVEETGAKARGGNFGAWRDANPIEQDMLDALLNFKGHLIVTMRTKNDYVIEGKSVTKVGTKAVQREGAEYELDVVMDMVQGTATVTKTRYTPLEGMVLHHPGETEAELILEQLGQGVDPVQQILDELLADGMTYQGAIALHARAKQRGILEHPAAHPGTGEPSTVEAVLAEYGGALRPAAVPDQAPAAVSPPSEAVPAVSPGRVRPSAAPEQQPAAPDRPEPATAPQMRRIHAVLNKVGITDRTERHTILSVLVGRHISTANELSKADAGDVIDSLDSALGQPDPAAYLRSVAANISPAAA